MHDASITHQNTAEHCKNVQIAVQSLNLGPDSTIIKPRQRIPLALDVVAGSLAILHCRR